MEVFVRQLQELTNPSFSSTKDQQAREAVSDHCKHVAVKLLRRFQHGTRGALELRYLLEDLLASLPDANPSSIPPNGSTRTYQDPFRDIRAFARLVTTEHGIELPLKQKPKRPASIDAAALVNNGTKRTKANEIENGPTLQRELANVQLLYGLFNDIDRYDPSKPKLSISQLLSEALSDAAHSGIKVNSITASNKLDQGLLRQAIDSLLPPAPRGQTLRDRTDAVFAKAPRLNGSSSSYIDFLESVLELLARLCAPIRDEQVKIVRSSLGSCKEYLSLQGVASPKLANSISVAEEQLKTLVQDMQNDLHLFNLGITVGTTNETELRKVIRQEAMERERKALKMLYGDPLERTRQWMERMDGSKRSELERQELATSLVEALFKPQPMVIDVAYASGGPTGSADGNDPAPTENVIPPIFHLAARDFFISQNRLQAFTILATLSTIVPVSTVRAHNGKNGATAQNGSSSWSERVWTLLNSEMEDDERNAASKENDEPHIKLANLADEVVKLVRDRTENNASVDEAKIRASVDRMLRLEDRVFALLHKRLKTALVEAIVRKDENGRTIIQVKGFSVSPLERELNITVRQLKGILNWACECWKIDE